MNLRFLLGLLRSSCISVVHRPTTLQRGEIRVRVRFFGRPDGPLLLICPGFGASSADYEPLAEVFGQHYRVGRLAHPGSDRWAAFGLLPRYLYWRWRDGSSQAALKVRSQFHSETIRRLRLAQLRLALDELAPVALAGHSFGTDTVLLAARERAVSDLFLFSPHPPGYLLAAEDYPQIQCHRALVISGTRDRTPDGVGPEERMEVADAIPVARPLLLPGVAHMDFAFTGAGPPEWPVQLSGALGGDWSEPRSVFKNERVSEEFA